MENKVIRPEVFTWVWAISPMFIGILLVALLAEFQIIEFHFYIQDLGVFLLFASLFLGLLTLSVVVSHAGIVRLEAISEQYVQTTFADDRARFLRRLDHEIKNPLMGIKTAMDNLAETSDPREREAIRLSINEQIDRLTRLVADLRRIGDMEHYEIECFPVDTRMLLEDAVSMIHDDVVAQDRNLQIDIHKNLPIITGDYDLLLLAVHNVLTNAVKYTKPGDKIRLKTDSDETHFTIYISDTGPGISENDLPYIWDELYRSEQVKDIAGSGIGLALVKRIVERHRGKVGIESTPGEGTTVKIRLTKDLTQSSKSPH